MESIKEFAQRSVDCDVILDPLNESFCNVVGHKLAFVRAKSDCPLSSNANQKQIIFDHAYALTDKLRLVQYVTSGTQYNWEKTNNFIRKISDKLCF